MPEVLLMAGFGVFGKIPALGDFLRVGLSAEFVTAWDDWLQRALVTARADLGERWDECYLTAPIWRFTLPAGLAGNSVICGIMMASVDRVGRRYPLTLCAPVSATETALVHFANSDRFGRLEDIALTALEEELSRDALLEELRSVSVIEPAHPEETDGHYSGAMLPEQILAARQLRRTHADAAIWTANLEGDHRMVVTSGFPGPSDSVGLFDLTAPAWRASETAAST